MWQHWLRFRARPARKKRAPAGWRHRQTVCSNARPRALREKLAALMGDEHCASGWIGFMVRVSFCSRAFGFIAVDTLRDGLPIASGGYPPVNGIHDAGLLHGLLPEEHSFNTSMPTNSATAQTNATGSTPMARTCRANAVRTARAQDRGRTAV